MPVETWLYFILGIMILGSVVALEIRNILSSIVSIGVVGLGVSIAFLLLQAPDLAIVQFLFEIFGLIILVRAFAGKEFHSEIPEHVNGFQVVSSIILLAAIFIVSIPAFRLLPPFGNPIMDTADYYLANGIKETGAVNIVATIVLDYRGYDTLGEVTVLSAAILGTVSILRVRNVKGSGRKVS